MGEKQCDEKEEGEISSKKEKYKFGRIEFIIGDFSKSCLV